MPKWTAANIPSQHGRSFLITGVGGLAFEDALALARAGAEVILAGRDPAKGGRALDELRKAVPGATISFKGLDLANLKSVAAFSERLKGERDHLDVLINNAGIMAPPTRMTTFDGFELQFGTNYLGHFALTAHLLPLLRKCKDPQVVSLSSVAARQGAIDFDNLQAQRGYKALPAYSQSKLACLMFAFELQRQSDAAGWGVKSVAAHPGISRTNLLHNAPGKNSAMGLARSWLWFLFQPAAQGALPTLFASTAPEAKGGGYYGPDKLSETRGHPSVARAPPQAFDTAVATRLWRVSELLAQVRFE